MLRKREPKSLHGLAYIGLRGTEKQPCALPPSRRCPTDASWTACRVAPPLSARATCMSRPEPTPPKPPIQQRSKLCGRWLAGHVNTLCSDNSWQIVCSCMGCGSQLLLTTKSAFALDSTLICFKIGIALCIKDVFLDSAGLAISGVGMLR